MDTGARMHQIVATTAGSAVSRRRSGSDDEDQRGERTSSGNLFYTAVEPFSERAGPDADIIARLIGKIDELTTEVARLKNGEVNERKKTLRFLNTTETESGDEDDTDFQPKERRRRASSKKPWERDLLRLAKILKTKELDPKDEKQFEDVVEEWELRGRGCGMQEEVLKHLLLHLGSPSVTHAARGLRLEDLTWKEMKDTVVTSLFPFSDYVRQLEKEMEKVDRTQPINTAVVQLTRLSERHRNLCKRWQRRNTFQDDRLKEALLLKLPKDQIAACLMIPNFKTISFAQFVHHCQMVLAAVAIGNTKGKPAPLGEENVKPTAAQVSAVDVAILHPPAASLPDRTQAVEQRCPNCGQPGHYLRNYPQPRVKCEVCGRSGHRKEICFKAQKETPDGKVRTSYLRMTRSGIHLDLIDEAMKKSLFEAMRRHLEGQETQYAKAKVRAAAKRAEKRKTERRPGTELGESSPSESEATELAAAVERIETPEVSEVKTDQGSGSESSSRTKYVDVELFERRIPGLLDSGAVVSLLPEETWNQIPEEQRGQLATTTVGHRPISGLGGRLKVKTIADVPIAVSGRGLLQRFFVSPDTGSIILGMDALKGLGIRMDFHTGEIVFNSDLRPIPESAMLGVSPLCVRLVKTSKETELVRRGKGCTEGEARKAYELFSRHPEIWERPEVGACRLACHQIDTGTSPPVAVRARRLPPEKLKELQLQLRELQESGAIVRSESPWASPVVLVPKSNGKVRLCVDYRKLNAVTRRDQYPLPRITELLDALGTARVFSTLDLTSGFHQILLDPDSRPKTAFITPEGLYEFQVLPFGLTNTPSPFQRAMDRLFQNHPASGNVGVYMDDIVVHTSTAEEHLSVLSQVCTQLKAAKLFVNLEKTVVFAREVKYLGFIVGEGGPRPDPEQIQALKDLKAPSDVTGVRRSLGLTGYFRRFIPDFSQKSLPLTRLLKKGTPFQWDEACHSAWTQLKEELGGPTVRLSLPLSGKIFTLDTDASDRALGAVLLQENEEGALQPLSYASRTLTQAEINWTTREKEAFAIVWGIVQYATYLRWQPHFLVRSDHQSLRWLWRSENRRIIRWALLLQEYNFSVEYNKGTQHEHADIFSRDVPSNLQEDAITDRIAIRPHVFAVEDSPISRTTRFPTLEEIEEAQGNECTGKLAVELKLRKGAQGLYQSPGGQIFVPTKYRRPLMYYSHFGKLGVHQGINKAHARLRRTFWWPGMRNDIQEYHNHCITCARKRPKPLTKGRGHLLAGHLGAVVAVDVVGPFETKEGALHFLTLVDHFSRYAHAAPLLEVTSTRIWEIIFTQWVTYFGTPAYLLTDNATVFRSREFEDQVKEFGIKTLHSFPYHPQGNGIVEAFHLFLKKSLFAVLRIEKETVQTAIGNILMAYRSTPHLSTGETPFYIVTGMDMVLPWMQDWVEVTSTPTLAKRVELLKELRDQAFERTAKRAVARAAALPKRDKEPLEVGDLVLSWLDPNERLKLQKTCGGTKAAPLWSGPCRVLRRLGNRSEAYVVRRLWEGGKTKEYRRESLMKLPKVWDQESAEAALKDLLADIKKPQRKSGVEIDFDDSVEEEETIKELPEWERRREFVQELVESEEDKRQPEAEAEEETRKETSADKEDKDEFQKKRRRRASVQCIAWGEVEDLLGFGGRPTV